ncbi:hypothetical protein ACIRRH_35595 [Kitasatospora sp. NPDC101235]|uniref:hypothetical protein n=1 Tax=Kitasatospora sp. NPDC101235 TaxID=3364101 RepID=UPI00382C86CD
MHQLERSGVDLKSFVLPDVCLRRNSERPANRRVPDDVLRWQHQLAVEALPGLTAEGFDEVRLYPAVSRSGR